MTGSDISKELIAEWFRVDFDEAIAYWLTQTDIQRLGRRFVSDATNPKKWTRVEKFSARETDSFSAYSHGINVADVKCTRVFMFRPDYVEDTVGVEPQAYVVYELKDGTFCMNAAESTKHCPIRRKT